MSSQVDLAKEFDLPSDVLSLFSDDVKKKLESYVEEKVLQIASFKKKLSYMQVSNEQEILEEENKCKLLDEEVHNLRKSYADAMHREEDRKVTFSHMETQIHEYRLQIDDLLKAKTDAEQKSRTFQGENEYLSDEVKRKAHELSLLQSELQTIKNELSDFRTDKFRLQLRLQELEEQESALKGREVRCSSERERLERLVELLEKQLRERNDMLSSVRHEFNVKTLNLESQLHLKMEELTNTLEINKTLKEKADRLQQSADTYLERIKRLQEEQISQEEIHTQEVAPLRKLIEIQKEKSEYFEKKAEELHSALTELRNVFQVAKEEYLKAEAENQLAIEQLNHDLESSKENVATLRRELEDANVLLDKFRIKGITEEELRQMNPAVASVISKLKSSRSLTQIYSEYVQVVEERDQLQLEVRRLSDYLTEIMHQLEEKGPAIRRQREDCLLYQESVTKLSQQLMEAMKDMNRLEEETAQHKRKCDFYQRDASMWKSQSEDLSKQLRVLLCELESARGRSVQMEADSSTPDFADVDISKRISDEESIGNQIITSNVLTFRSISELQQQNQRLLHLTRTLTRQLEEREASDQTEKVKSLSRELETMQEDVERLRSAHQRQKTQMELFQRQRDMYKILLQERDRESRDVTMNESSTTDEQEIQSSDINQSTSSPVKLNVSGTGAQHSSEETVSALKELQKEFQHYREEKLSSDKVYADTIEQLRQENSTLRLQNAKILSQLDFSHEKFKTVESHLISYKSEVKVLRDMKVQQSTRLTQLETDNSRLQRDLSDVNRRNSSLQVEMATLQSRVRSLQDQEKRHREDLDHAHAQRRQQQELTHHLQAIQTNLEQRDSMEKQQLKSHNDSLIQECASLRAQLTSLRADLQNTEEQLRKAREQMAKERDSRLSIEQQMTQLRREHDEARHVHKLRTDVAVQTDESEDRSARTSLASQSIEDREPEDDFSAFSLKLKVKELEAEKESHCQRQENLSQQLEDYRRLCNDLEQQLSDQVEELKRVEEELASKLSRAQERNDFLLKQLSMVEEQCKSSIDENYKVTEEAHAQNSELRKQLIQTQHELQEAIQRRDIALLVESTAKDTIAVYRQSAEEADAKYQRELVLHAADVEVLEGLRQKHAELQSQQGSHDERISELQDKMKHSIEENAQLQKQFKEERDSLKKENVEFREQNNSLQDEISELTQQIINLKRSLDEGSFEQSFKEDIETSEQLMEMNKNLRRQLRLAEANAEVYKGEVSRLTHNISSVQRQLEEARGYLLEERENSHRELESAQQHAQMLARVEQSQQLQESNRCLRRDLNEVSEALRESQTRVEKFESSLEPLQMQLSEYRETSKAYEHEIQSLKEERTRWKERCNQLLTNVERMDPEKYQAVCRDKESLQALLSMKENLIASLESERMNYQNQLQVAEGKVRDLTSLNERLQSEKVEFETLVSNHSSELARRDGRYNQLRDIARKYLNDANDLKKKLEEKENEFSTMNGELQKEKVELNSCVQGIYNLLTKLLSIKDNHSIDWYSTFDPSTSFDATKAQQLLDSLTRDSSILSQIDQLLSNQNSQLKEAEQSVGEYRSRIHVLESAIQKLRNENSDLQSHIGSSHAGSQNSQSSQATAGSQQAQSSPVATLTPIEPVVTVSKCTPTSTAPQFTTSSTFPSQPPRVSVTPQLQTNPAHITSESLATNNNFSPSVHSRQLVEIRPMPSAVATVTPNVTLSEDPPRTQTIGEPSASSSLPTTAMSRSLLPLPHTITGTVGGIKRRNSGTSSNLEEIGESSSTLHDSGNTTMKRFCPEPFQSAAVETEVVSLEEPNVENSEETSEDEMPVLLFESETGVVELGNEMVDMGDNEQVELQEITQQEVILDNLEFDENNELDFEENDLDAPETDVIEEVYEDDDESEGDVQMGEEEEDEQEEDDEEEDEDDEDEEELDDEESDMSEELSCTGGPQDEVIEISDSDEEDKTTSQNISSTNRASSEGRESNVKDLDEAVRRGNLFHMQQKTETDSHEHAQEGSSSIGPSASSAEHPRPKITPIVWGSPTTTETSTATTGARTIPAYVRASNTGTFRGGEVTSVTRPITRSATPQARRGRGSPGMIRSKGGSRGAL